MKLHRVRRALKGRAVTLLWRWRGISVADRVVVAGMTPHLEAPGRVSLGSRVSFRGFGRRTWIYVHHGASLEIGDRTFVNSGVRLDVAISVTIGRACLIGDDVVIQDSGYHPVDERSEPALAPVVIGDNVWIARNAMILPGVTVGDGSVIGAGAVVTRSVPPRSLAVGNPARVIRDLAVSDGFVRIDVPPRRQKSPA